MSVPQRLPWQILFIGVVPLFLMSFGLGLFLEHQDFSTWAFVLVYASLFGIPFMWALPMRMRDLDRFDRESALIHGLLAVAAFGLFHVVHFLVDGSAQSLVSVVPIIAIITASFSKSLFTQDSGGDGT